MPTGQPHQPVAAPLTLVAKELAQTGDVNERWGLARHEAGHAAAFLLHGLGVRLAAICGRCGFTVPCIQSKGSFVVALIAAAGKAAENALAGMAPPPPDDAVPPVTAGNADGHLPFSMGSVTLALSQTDTDWHAMRAWATEVRNHKEWPVRMERLEGLAARLVTLHRALVVELAQALFIGQTLHFEEIQRIADKHGVAGPPPQSEPTEPVDVYRPETQPVKGPEDMNANLVKTVDSVAATRRERLRAYWQLVRKIAEGEKVNPAILDRAMTEAGRSIESLKADVEAVQARYVLAETATKLGPLAHERDKLSKTIDAEDEKLAEATRRHSDAVRPLLLRLQEIQAEEAIATSARDRLISECPYPDALEALNEARSRSTAARQARHNLIVEAENAKRQAGFCDTQADLNDLRGFKREKTAEEEKASRYYQKAADALAKLPAADKEIEAADKLEEAAIETLAAP